MSWGAVIGAGVGLVGSVVAGKQSSKASAQAAAAEKASLDFEKERYAEWQEVYGDLQSNLSDYYTRLTPEFYEAQGLESVERERATLDKQLTETLAQRGISDSGIAAQAEIDLALDTSQARADVRRSAPGLAAEESRGFLQIGLGQNPGDSFSRVLASQATSRRTESTDKSKASASATQAAVTGVGTALVDYING